MGVLMATVWKWVDRIIAGVWAIDAISAFHLKSVAIDEMHNPLLVKDPVAFTSLGGEYQISAQTAFNYHTAMWIFFICPMLIAASQGMQRRLRQK